MKHGWSPQVGRRHCGAGQGAGISRRGACPLFLLPPLPLSLADLKAGAGEQNCFCPTPARGYGEWLYGELRLARDSGGSMQFPLSSPCSLPTPHSPAGWEQALEGGNCTLLLFLAE